MFDAAKRVGVGVVWLVFSATASAATVRGSVSLPPEPRNNNREAHWRVENGVLPVGARVPDERLDVIIALGMLEGKDSPKTLPNATVSVHGLRIDPRVIVLSVGGTVDLRNDDRVPHVFYVENGGSLMAPSPTPAGKTRTQKFVAAGEYRIRDEEFPHIEAIVLVLQTPHVARLDEKGNFKLDVPEGKYRLRVFARGAWVVTQTLEVGSRTTEVTIKVPPPAEKKP
jgi:hypothetical protein